MYDDDDLRFATITAQSIYTHSTPEYILIGDIFLRVDIKLTHV